eukprot:3018313-Prymnesium_polylepis.1
MWSRAKLQLDTTSTAVRRMVVVALASMDTTPLPRDRCVTKMAVHSPSEGASAWKCLRQGDSLDVLLRLERSS